MASPCTGRKCFHFVSRVGPAHRRAPSPEIFIADPAAKWSVATLLVVLFGAVALSAMVVAVLVLWRRRIKQEPVVRSEVTVDNGGAGKPGQGDEDVEKEGKGSAGFGAVERVVMAGETKPTYVATPTIQCPPFMIQAKAEDK